MSRPIPLFQIKLPVLILRVIFPTLVSYEMLFRTNNAVLFMSFPSFINMCFVFEHPIKKASG